MPHIGNGNPIPVVFGETTSRGIEDAQCPVRQLDFGCGTCKPRLWNAEVSHEFAVDLIRPQSGWVLNSHLL